MNAIDLVFQSGANSNQLNIFLISNAGNQAFTVGLPAHLQQHQQAWWRRFLVHHDPAAVAIPADVVEAYSQRLQSALASWIKSGPWQPLQNALQQSLQLPLRLRFEGTPPWLERLPWEMLPWERAIWRIQGPGLGDKTLQNRYRKPRLLLLVGDETSLQLDDEIEQLQALAAHGRIALHPLRGAKSSRAGLHNALLDPRGWDALVFLGHSAADPTGGGRLQLGDGNWIAAATFRSDLEAAASKGLGLVLLSSCSGLDLAQSCSDAGIPWAVCFLEPVPAKAASTSFAALLKALEQGHCLTTALTKVRHQLTTQGPAGVALLLSVVATNEADVFHLPLRKRRQFVLRLAQSQKSQAIVSAVAISIGLAADINPANPLSQWGLDQRLRVQQQWRLVTHQRGPRGPALPVLLLDQRQAYPALGVPTSTSSDRVSRQALIAVLQKLAPERVPKVAIDVVLDEPAVDPLGTSQLAALIKQQQRPQVFAGFYGANSDGPKAGIKSKPLPILQKAGLQAFDLSVGTTAWPPSGPAGDQRPVPLQLLVPITDAFFAHALSDHPHRYLPSESVIDWSLDWQQLLRQVTPEELTKLKAPALLVGTDGLIDPQRPDLFDAPSAVQAALPAWGGTNWQLPGALVQAVLAQSLNLNHWLTPLSTSCSTAAAAGLGVLLAAAQERRLHLLWLLAGISFSLILLALQVAVGYLILIPLILPLSTLFATTLIRRN